MNNHVSLNTILLYVFRELSSVGRSFSEGALAFEDEGLCDSLWKACGYSDVPEGEWREMRLSVPVVNQCGCVMCKPNNRPKLAVDFRLRYNYIQIRPRAYPGGSLNGLFDYALASLGVASEAKIGCHNRAVESKFYSFDAYDRDTYALLFSDDVKESLVEHSLYNSRGRSGDEFYVPTRMMQQACSSEIV
jgi:hypothetical protein